MSHYPARLGQAHDHRAVESARRPEVDVLHSCLLAQLGRFQPQGQAAAVARFTFAVHQQAESLVKTQTEILAALEFLADTEHHAEQPERLEFVASPFAFYRGGAAI